MPWKQCARCGWWQRHGRPCVGCTHQRSTQPAKPLGKTYPAVTPTILQDRWAQAKTGATNPKHTKVERMCMTCFLCTVGKGEKLQGLWQLSSPLHASLPLPMATPSMVAKYDTTTQGPSPLQAPTNDVAMGMESETAPPMPLAAFSRAASELTELNPPQLRAELNRLEGVLQSWSPTSLPSLRKQLEEAQQAVKKELASRRSPGKTLDQAETRHRQTQKATQMAESALKQAKEAVSIAQDAVLKARDNEAQALQDLNRLRAMIADPLPEPQATPRMDIPPQVLAGVYAVLQHAGLQPEYLHKVGGLLGAPMPPTPPPPTDVTGNGAPTSPPSAPGVGTQLLASPGETRRHSSLTPHRRQGRSPHRRPLPRRSDLADFADTAKDSSLDTRTASRTPNRSPKAARHVSPNHVPSSLHGAAPPRFLPPFRPRHRNPCLGAPCRRPHTSPCV